MSDFKITQTFALRRTFVGVSAETAEVALTMVSSERPALCPPCMGSNSDYGLFIDAEPMKTDVEDVGSHDRFHEVTRGV